MSLSPFVCMYFIWTLFAPVINSTVADLASPDAFLDGEGFSEVFGSHFFLSAQLESPNPTVAFKPLSPTAARPKRLEPQPKVPLLVSGDSENLKTSQPDLQTIRNLKL